MAEYLHGAYGIVNADAYEAAVSGLGAIVYVGTAPVHTVEGGAANVNKPILVRNMAEFIKAFGYSEDWASYTLCEAASVHFNEKGVGPIVCINVLNPTEHAGDEGTATKTPANGIVTIAEAGTFVLDSFVVKSGSTTKVKGTDYKISYDYTTGVVTIVEIGTGLGTSALTITYDTVDPSDVAASDVIGSSDGLGTNTGLYAIKDVYQLTGMIPAYIAAPGWSSVKTIHDAMYAVSKKINGHWDAYMFVDLPIVNGETPLTFDTIAAYKNSNGFDKENETVYFPLAQGLDGKTYHLSTIAAANFQELLNANDDIPYRSASNTPTGIIKNLYLGTGTEGRVYDDQLINEKLNKHGIASAAYMSGRWAIWGAHSANYEYGVSTGVSVAETSRMMLYYLSNDFQMRRAADIDKPLTLNDLRAIVAEEQARLDALINIGALTYGVVAIQADADAYSDLINGDYAFSFNVTTTPLAKSLTAIVNWTDAGFVTYFEGLE